MPNNQKAENFPFKPGTRLNDVGKQEIAKELVNALWMWNINRQDAIDVIKMVLQILPHEIWPNNVPLEPKGEGKDN